ncbi:MAG: DUF1501 domain-containing protein [Lysobacteraceae bacterium]
MTMPSITRRRFLAALGGTAMLTLWPGLSPAASGGQTRLVVVLLRGAMDGLHLLPPRGDADYLRARGQLAVTDALPLDGSFGLHPKMTFAHQLFADKQLLPLVAVAPPYQRRSHFDAQDCLENGTAAPGGARDGWIGRCIQSMVASEGVAIAQVMPLAMRGSERAGIWSPPLPRDLPDTLMQQLEPLYAADARLAPMFADAMAAAATGMGDTQGKNGRGAFRLPDAMAAAAKRMRGPDAARIAFVEDSGWDTHRGQQLALDRKFAELDAGLRAIREGLGDEWSRTTVAVVTEFGRTVASNGSAGTDHGVGGVSLLAGGAVRGGRVGGDWPGLSTGALLEGRDLRPTTDMRALFKGVLVNHLAVPETALETRIFPDSRAVRPLEGLLRA